MRKPRLYVGILLLASRLLPGQAHQAAGVPAPALALLQKQPGQSVEGRVTGETGDALPGVNVLLKGTNIGTATGSDGKFALALPEGQAGGTLVFSYVGYVTQEISVGSQALIAVKMKPDSQSLTDVVVVGYGTQNRRDVTGAVSTVKAADLNKTNAVSVDNLLQGKAAGLNVSTNTAQPGGAVNITVRGAISPNGDNSPLYVIDGFPITTNASTEANSVTGEFRGGFARSPLDNLNPNDIESIDILKDASATAIYGSAAANGVILITTKKGREGKTTVNYSGTYSIQTRKKYLQPLTAADFRNNVNVYGLELYKFNNKLAPYGNGTPPPGGYTPYFTAQQVADAGTGTNYIDFVLRDGRINDHNLSFATGTATTKLFTSFNYYDQRALLRNSNFVRFAGRVNLEQKIGSRVTFGLGLSYSQVNSDNVPTGQSNDIDSPSLLQTALQFPSDVPALDAAGLPSRAYYARTPNPASYFQIVNQTFSKRLLVTPSLQVKLLDGLRLSLTGGIDNTTTDRQFFIPVAANFSTVSQGNAQRGLTKLNNYSSEAFLNYDKTLGKGQLSVVAGVGFYASSFNDFGLNVAGFNTDAFGVDNIGIAYNKGRSSVSSNRTSRTKLSQFTRLNYTLLDKYILQFTGRFDGASNFPRSNRFGFFPGVSAGWLLNQEEFLKDVSWLSQLKVRGGYGTSGNESITVNGSYGQSLYSLTDSFGGYSYLIGNQLYNAGFVQVQLGNPDLKWETDVTVNAGLDFGFVNNRFSGSVDVFQRTAKDLLDFRVLPASNAITRQAFNVGSTRSRGVEVTLRSENVITKNFTWSTLLTFGTARTTWAERNPAVALPSYVGYNDPIRAIYGWKTDGLIRSAGEVPAYQPGAYVGNVKYVDLNGDGKLDINDVTYLGNNDPTATFGLNNTFRFFGFDLSVYLYGAAGNATFDGYQQFVQLARLTRIGAPTNVEARTLDVYTSFNPTGTYPGFANDPAAASNPSGQSDFRLVGHSYFVRLRDVNLGYSLPTGLLGQKKFVQSVRVFANFNNLGYLTNIRGLDPETERNNNPYPTALTTAFGLSAQF